MNPDVRFLLDRNSSLEDENQRLRKKILKIRAREVWVVMVTGAIFITFGAWIGMYWR